MMRRSCINCNADTVLAGFGGDHMCAILAAEGHVEQMYDLDVLRTTFLTKTNLNFFFVP